MQSGFFRSSAVRCGAARCGFGQGKYLWCGAVQRTVLHRTALPNRVAPHRTVRKAAHRVMFFLYIKMINFVWVIVSFGRYPPLACASCVMYTAVPRTCCVGCRLIAADNALAAMATAGIFGAFAGAAAKRFLFARRQCRTRPPKGGNNTADNSNKTAT